MIFQFENHKFLPKSLGDSVIFCIFAASDSTVGAKMTKINDKRKHNNNN